MDKRVKITIDALGRPTIEAVGFGGVGCTEATAALEKVLAQSGEESVRVLKPEWHEVNSDGLTEEIHLQW